MPDLDPVAFRQRTAPLALGVGYGGHMTKVLAALEAYWENRNSPNVQILESLLYNVWKQCNKWLKLKEEKHGTGNVSELSQRRQWNVKRLRDDALLELAVVSPKAREALDLIEDRKGHGLMAPKHQLAGLDGGYSLEREHYLSRNKQSGSAISMTAASGHLRYSATRGNKVQERREELAKKLQRKGFGNLSLSDVFKLRNKFEEYTNVVYMNKIARLKHLVSIEDGLFTNLDGVALQFDKVTGRLVMEPYVMDKYGNVFIFYYGQGDYNYVTRGTGGDYRLDTTRQVNHSSMLGGAECLCAGAIAIGYDCLKKKDEPGVLGAIDNSSGHYKPSPDQLRNCLRALAAQDVNVSAIRVGDWSGVDGPKFYWGNDFLNGDIRRWQDETVSSSAFRVAPPIRPSI